MKLLTVVEARPKHQHSDPREVCIDAEAVCDVIPRIKIEIDAVGTTEHHYRVALTSGSVYFMTRRNLDKLGLRTS